MRNSILFVNMFAMLFLLSCNGSRKAAETQSTRPVNVKQNSPTQAGPPTVVYKTTANFDDNVPVIMNASKTEIVSYPDPSDVGDFSKPARLKDGYLLDNRGISENAVFLRYTYSEYSRMEQAPSLSVLKENILEKYPLKELVYCGVRYQYKNIVEDLNALIDSGFAGCKRANITAGFILRE